MKVGPILLLFACLLAINDVVELVCLFDEALRLDFDNLLASKVQLGRLIDVGISCGATSWG